MSETKNEWKRCWSKQRQSLRIVRRFRTLLESTVWVPGTAAEGEAVIEAVPSTFDTGKRRTAPTVIPFFTSLEALQQAVEDERAFVLMPRCVHYLK